MHGELKTKMYWVSVGSPTAWGDVQSIIGKALKALEHTEAERDTALAALDNANAEIVMLKAQNQSLRFSEREHVALAVAALGAAE